MTSYTSHLACFAAFQREQLASQIPYSTDPEWMRRQIGQHQYTAVRCIGLAVLGLAFMGVIVAIGSI